MTDYLYLINKKYLFKIYAFVLMLNHFHLLGATVDTEVGIIMRDFMTDTSREMNRLSGRINQNWGGRHYKCELTNSLHLINTYKYIYQNPIRAGLVARAEDWKYSTLHGILGRSKLIIPIEHDAILFNAEFDERQLAWINKPISNQNYLSMKAALTRRTFDLPNIKKKINPLNFETI